MKTRITQLTVAPKGADLYDERSTQIEIDDGGGGEFVKITQPLGNSDIRFDVEEWPYIRDAINNMIESCEK